MNRVNGFDVLNAVWVVAMTKPNFEHVASSYLESRGYHPWFLKQLKVVRIFNKRTLGLRPLFPGYLFVPIVNGQIWSVKRAIGVNSVLSIDGEAITVPGFIMSELMSRGDENGVLIDNGENRQMIAVGDRVRFNGGPLEGLIGIVGRLDKSERARIWCSALKTTVNVALRDVGRVD